MAVFTLDEKSLLACCAILYLQCCRTFFKTTASRTHRAHFVYVHSHSPTSENAILLHLKSCTQKLPFVSHASNRFIFPLQLMQCGEGHVWEPRRGHWKINMNSSFFVSFFKLKVLLKLVSKSGLLLSDVVLTLNFSLKLCVHALMASLLHKTGSKLVFAFSLLAK